MDKDSINRGLRTGGAPGFKFENVGDTVTGVVLDAEWEQERDFVTGVPKEFADGNPIQQLVVTLQTENVTDDDDGRRRVFLKGSKKRPTPLGAVVEALKTADVELEEGGTLSLSFVSLGEAARGMSAPKNYAAEYYPPGY